MAQSSEKRGPIARHERIFARPTEAIQWLPPLLLSKARSLPKMSRTQGRVQAERSSLTPSECTRTGAPRTERPIDRFAWLGMAAIDIATRPPLPKTSIEPRSSKI